MGIGMKQLIGLWGKNYKEVAEFLNFKSNSTIEKRIKNNTWQHHEVVAILQQIEIDTGVKVDQKLIKT